MNKINILLVLTHLDVANAHVYHDPLFVEMFLHKTRMDKASPHYEYVHDFLMHPIDESVFHMYDIRSVSHYGESNDVDSKQSQLKMFCDNRNIYMVVHQYDTCEYDHLNQVVW